MGAYLKEARGGLQVTGTAPDSPASKALQDGDVIRRIAANGQPPRTLKTMNQFELAKQQIGVVRQAVLEIDRPGRGTEYVQVTFQPGQLARFSTGKQSSAVTMFNTSN